MVMAPSVDLFARYANWWGSSVGGSWSLLCLATSQSFHDYRCEGYWLVITVYYFDVLMFVNVFQLDKEFINI